MRSSCFHNIVETLCSTILARSWLPTALEEALHLDCLSPRRRLLEQRQAGVVGRTLHQGWARLPASPAMLFTIAKGAAEGQQSPTYN